MQKENNKKISLAVLGIIVLIGVFYGGIAYGKNQSSTGGVNGFGVNMQNRTGQSGMGNRNNRMNGGGFTTGEIISKDDKSITVKITNGDRNSPDINGSTTTNTNATGSKIIFLSTNTEVAKTVSGNVNDLTTGTQVLVSGTSNPDGSITAKSIQIRPQVKQNIPTQ